jgi:hypothetical protein
MTSRHCAECDQANPGDARYCVHCGAKLSGAKLSESEGGLTAALVKVETRAEIAAHQYG